MVLSHLRFAAGVCVLAAGLLMGAGGAVAVADPDSSDSAAHGDQRPPTLQTAVLRKAARKAEGRAWRHEHARTARLARAGNQASSIPPARKSRRTSLAARTPRMGRKTTRTSVPRFLIRSPRFRTRSRRSDPVAAVPNGWRRFRAVSRRSGRRGSEPVAPVVREPVPPIAR